MSARSELIHQLGHQAQDRARCHAANSAQVLTTPSMVDLSARSTKRSPLLAQLVAEGTLCFAFLSRRVPSSG